MTEPATHFQRPARDISAITELVARARANSRRIAIVDRDGATTYGQLADDAQAFATVLLGGRTDLAESRVVIMVDSTARYVTALWAAMLAGAIAAPILPGLPDGEIDYFVADSNAVALVADVANADRLRGAAQRHGVPLLVIDEAVRAAGDTDLPVVTSERGSVMIYTSGTTGRPKGVVWTQHGLANQLAVMSHEWRWSDADVSLLVLPLHHVHGLVNVVLTTLWAGATCHMLGTSDPETVWRTLDDSAVTVFMAVPTIYGRLIAAHEAAPDLAARRSAACERIRLMVSGSAALPVSTLERWEAISGHRLLERYGMSELGMVLGNPYDGPRIAGTVGRPFPTVETRLIGDDGEVVTGAGVGTLEVRGPSVFREYLGRADATADAFHDGWFVTGDRVSIDADGVHRIVGRDSVDIIKTGGEKVSALEIEEVLRAHPSVAEIAVVGVPDPDWGEQVVAFVVAVDGADPASLATAELRDWARPHLANFKLPRRVALVADLPRNAMGKVVKTELRDTGV